MGGLTSTNERPADRTGQEARDHTGRGQRNLEKADGKVPDLGDRVGGKGCLWYGTTGRGWGGGDRGRHSSHTCPLAGAFT